MAFLQFQYTTLEPVLSNSAGFYIVWRCGVKRDRRFPVVLSKHERAALQELAAHERISAAAVVRRLIWREAAAKNLQPFLSSTEEMKQDG